MKDQAIKPSSRMITILLICCLLGSALIWSQLAAAKAAAETTPVETQKGEPGPVLKTAEFAPIAASQAKKSVKAIQPGFPLLNFQDQKKLSTRFINANGAAESLDAREAQPLGLMTGDFNNDGAADLISAFASKGNGGYLAFYQGNPETLSARSPKTFEAMKENRFPVPFSSKAVLVNLPVSPDLYGTGDFNLDGFLDVLVGARGDTALYLLAGNGLGGFSQQRLEMPGQVTALITGQIDPLDNAADAAVGIAGQNGSELLIYSGAAATAENAFNVNPRVYQLQGAATSLALGQLDADAPIDILAAVGTQAIIIHGSYPVKDENGAIEQTDNSNQIEIINQAFDIAAVRIGNFVWDRDYQAEIALLDTGGTVHIFERGELQTTAYSADEQKQLWRIRRDKALAQEAAHGENFKPQQATSPRQIWSETDNIQVTAAFEKSAVASPNFFTSKRMTTEAVDDLIVLDPTNQKLQVLVKSTDELKQSGEALSYSMTGDRAAISFAVEGTPVAALPMRLSVMTRPGIVLLNQESADISYLLTSPAATLTVTKTADTNDGTCNADCSLREAIHVANLTSAADLIMVPAGTYTTTIGPADDDFAVDPAAEQSGDFDVFYDLTITGAGQATTIIQAGATTATGLDRVLDAIQLSVGVPDLSLSGVTLRNGRCAAGTCGDGGGLRFTVDALAQLTISDATITGNRTEVNTANPANNGGGIDATFGTNNFTNVTVSNNVAGFRTDSCTNCSGEGGGIGLFGSNSSNPTALTMTNGTVTGNQALTTYTAGGRGGGLAMSLNSQTISGGTFTGNSADGDGGGFRLFTTTTFTGSPTINTNSSKQNGGGIWSDPIDDSNAPTTVSVTGATLQGNTADSDNTIGIAGTTRNGDGGAIFHDRGTLNLTTVSIGNTTANTAFNGGGIGHFYLGPNFAGNTATININGGSIVNNTANNNGGGVSNDATRTAGSTSTVSVGATTAVTFTSNKAKNSGGGISNSNAATAILNNMTLRSNQANSDNAGGGDGGAYSQNGGTTTFSGSLSIGGSGFANSAANGGGISNASGTLTLPTNASITFNTATGTGGGIFNGGTLAALTTPTITNNSAVNGGGIFTSNGVLTITNGSISNNTATGGASGGGILYGGSGNSTVTGTTVNNNTGSGIYITANSLDVTNTTVTGNTADGVSVTGTGTGSELISGNTIFNNGSLGIDLGDNGVTANDAGDSDGGPNNLQNYPVMNFVRRGDGVANVTLNSTASRNFRINFFANNACDASGNGEGEALLGTQNVTTNASGVVTFTTAALAFSTREQITATATDLVTGDTSEFSVCRQVNTLPTIAAQSGLTRQQGSLVSNSLIAVVNDVDQTENTLVGTVNGGATATVNGVTVSGIAIDSSGNVTANIIAGCGATTANFTVRVTDTAGEFNETTLTVQVTANTAPTVGNYTMTFVATGASKTVTPTSPPTDNGTFTASVSASAGFTGSLTINQTTGVVTIANANPAGTYTITVNVTDSCGLVQTQNFSLIVEVPTAAQVSISGRVLTANRRGLFGAILTISDQTGQSRTARTNIFGYYRFENIAAGQTYVVSVSAKNYTFAPLIISLKESLREFDFIALQ